MYDELVKSLRNCVADENGCCFRCPEDCNGPCQENLMTEAADAIEELLKAAKAMHTWIFLNSGDEQAAYDECGLTDEMNAALGYCGAYEMRVEPPREEPT